MFDFSIGLIPTAMPRIRNCRTSSGWFTASGQTVSKHCGRSTSVLLPSGYSETWDFANGSVTQGWRISPLISRALLVGISAP